MLRISIQMTTRHQRLFLVNIVDEYKDQILAYLTQAYNNHLNLHYFNTL